MRVLLDENVPHDLIPQLSGHDVVTVQGLGWAGLKNGDLLARVRDVVDVFVTMDRKLAKQHDLSGLPFGVVVILARSNRIPDPCLLRTPCAKPLRWSGQVRSSRWVVVAIRARHIAWI